MGICLQYHQAFGCKVKFTQKTDNNYSDHANKNTLPLMQLKIYTNIDQNKKTAKEKSKTAKRSGILKNEYNISKRCKLQTLLKWSHLIQ